MFFITEQGVWPQPTIQQICTENFLFIRQMDKVPSPVRVPIPSVRNIT